jgi:hypothetical protein
MPKNIILYGHGSWSAEDQNVSCFVPPQCTVYFFIPHNHEISEYRMLDIAREVMKCGKKGRDWTQSQDLMSLVVDAASGRERCTNYRLTPPGTLPRPKRVISPDTPLVYGTDPDGMLLSRYFEMRGFQEPQTRVLWVACRGLSGKETRKLEPHEAKFRMDLLVDQYTW